MVILVRYREVLSRRTLEVGCGAGRILGYVAQLGGEAHGIDISPAMVEHCRRRYPAADTRVGDLADIGRSAEGPFDAVLALDNVLDVFDDAERRRVLADLRALLAPDGLLIFSSHNLAYVDRAAPGDGDRSGRAGQGRARRLLSEPDLAAAVQRGARRRADPRPQAQSKAARTAAAPRRRLRDRQRLGPRLRVAALLHRSRRPGPAAWRDRLRADRVPRRRRPRRRPGRAASRSLAALCRPYKNRVSRRKLNRSECR